MKLLPLTALQRYFSPPRFAGAAPGFKLQLSPRCGIGRFMVFLLVGLAQGPTLLDSRLCWAPALLFAWCLASLVAGPVPRFQTCAALGLALGSGLFFSTVGEVGKAYNQFFGAGLLELTFVLLFALGLVCLPWCALFLSWRLLLAAGRALAGSGRLAPSTCVLLFLFLFFVVDACNLWVLPWHPYLSFASSDRLVLLGGICGPVQLSALFCGWVYLLWRLGFTTAPGCDAPHRLRFRRFSAVIVTSLAPIVPLWEITGYYQHQIQTRVIGYQNVVLIQDNVGQAVADFIRATGEAAARREHNSAAAPSSLEGSSVVSAWANVQAAFRTRDNLIQEIRSALTQSPLPSAMSSHPWFFWGETVFLTGDLSKEAASTNLHAIVADLVGKHFIGVLESMEQPATGTAASANSIAMLDTFAPAAPSIYRKLVRVPLWEYLPSGIAESAPLSALLARFLPSLYKFRVISGFPNIETDLTRSRVVFATNSTTIVPLVCLEGVISSRVADAIEGSSVAPTDNDAVLFVASSDAVFAGTRLPRLHALVERWNAALHGVTLVRATTTGISQVIAPWGEILLELPQNTATYGVARLPVVAKGPKPVLK